MSRRRRAAHGPCDVMGSQTSRIHRAQCATVWRTAHKAKRPRERKHAMNVGYALGEAETRAVLKEACEVTGR